MLCHEKRLHSCAIAERDIPQQDHESASRKGLSAYCSRGKRYQFIHRKEYGDAGSMAQVRDVMAATNWTKQAVDMGRKAAIERQIAEIRGEIDIIKGQYLECGKEVKEAEDKITTLNKDIKEIADDKEQKQQALTEWNAIPTKIQQEKRERSPAHRIVGRRQGTNVWISSRKRPTSGREDSSYPTVLLLSHLISEGLSQT